MRPRHLAVLLLLVRAVPAAALTQPETDALVKLVDDRQRSSGDYKALCYMEAKEKDKTDVVYELVVYRREAEEKLMLLFTRPKSEAGKGYLRLDKNLWLYDPATGRWERRTERERIGALALRRLRREELEREAGLRRVEPRANLHAPFMPEHARPRQLGNLH